jgi:GSCFA family protein
MRSPYEDLPPTAFWRTGVVGQAPDAIKGLYAKKFAISRKTRIATAGSCFAQHLARHLRARDFTLIDAEPPPPGLSAESAAAFGYGIYSARYGNIYTARQLLQLAQSARGTFTPSGIVWEKDGRCYDALRPSVEPEGLSSRAVLADHRAWHLKRVAEVLDKAELFVFTMGLTEAWVHAPSGTVYPTAPGTIAGRYDPDIHRFHNFTFPEIHGDMTAFFALAKAQNPKLRFLLTVSPVPMTATASGQHVLQATTYTKSVLRAVAGQLAQERDDVDYFPSYEIVTSALARGRFYEDNLRNVRPDGVEAAIAAFAAEHDPDAASPVQAMQQESAAPPPAPESAEDDAICEEILLDAFAP